MLMTYYVCPHCGVASGEMTPSETRMEPTADQLAARPELAAVANEVLICTCGEPLTWFDLEERSGWIDIEDCAASPWQYLQAFRDDEQLRAHRRDLYVMEAQLRCPGPPFEIQIKELERQIKELLARRFHA